MCDHAKQGNERIMERPSKSREGAATGVLAIKLLQMLHYGRDVDRSIYKNRFR